ETRQPPSPHFDAGQLPTRVRPVRQRPTHRGRPRARAARADTRRRPHLAHHPLRRDQRPTAFRTPPNDSVVATRSARELSSLGSLDARPVFVGSATLLCAVVGATGFARYGDMGSPTGSHVGDAVFFG